jgi:bifunctional pyridoxal-dependent enzyme with beta-cystathionase and maltose regulon repressor activities
VFAAIAPIAAFDRGREYGNGYGFLRMNLACRRELLKEGLERLKRSIHSYRKGISNGII